MLTPLLCTSFERKASIPSLYDAATDPTRRLALIINSAIHSLAWVFGNGTAPSIGCMLPYDPGFWS